MTRTRYKILPDDEAPYFVTVTTVEWLSLFSNPDIANIIFDSLHYLQEHERLTLYAYVIMENHAHLVAWAEDLPKELANFKSFTARKSIDYYELQNNRFILDQLAENNPPYHHDRTYRFWQEGVAPKRIYNRSMLEQKIQYIHYNPVRRGYVELPEHWMYSSARNYAGLSSRLDVCMEW